MDESTKINKNRLYILAIIVLVLLLILREGCNSRNTDKLISDIANYKTESSVYKTKLGLEINTNKALALQTQDQMKSLLASNDTMREWVKEFKEIKGGVIVRETTIVREVAVPFDKLIPCDFKPFQAKKETKDFLFYTTIANTGLTIDSLKIPNEAKIIIGDKKTGFLKMKTSLVIEVNNSNPYIKTSNISGFVYEPKKKWYERMWVNLVAGAVVGAAGSKYVDKKLNH
jgi:hypothetical protein